MSGMHSDNYELARSLAPQSIKDYGAFTDKQWNYKPDSNGSVYQAQNANVEFDLSSIYQSDAYTDVSDMYIVIPTCMVATVSAGATTLAVPTAGYNLCSLKNNFQNLIHSMELVLNGKTIHDHQSFLNVYSHFKMLSSMSPSDLKSNNTNFGMSPDVDNHKSIRFATAAGADTSGLSGYGITNNVPYQTSASFQQTLKQNDGAGNDAIKQRINRVVDTTPTTAANSYNNLFGVTGIMNVSNLGAEYKPYYTVNGNFMYWYDYAIINLKYILDSVAKIGLVKKADLRLRMYVNTGAVQVTVASPNLTTTTYTAFKSSFANTCPITVNYLNQTAANGGLPDTATRITAGLYIGSPPTTFNGGGDSTIAISQQANTLTQCRLYYSNIKLDPNTESQYINANRSKQIIYEKIIFASVLNVPPGGLMDKTISSSILNPIGLVIVPFVSKAGTSTLLTTALGFCQYESPWDTAPSTNGPLSLTDISVSLGGKKIANEVLNYTYENFLHQVSLAETLTSTDIGLNCGLINQEFWENGYRVYYMDLARSRDVDKDTPRELTVKARNNTAVPLDCLMFLVYLDKFNIDVVTGAIVS
jgi:hypothetical protein